MRVKTELEHIRDMTRTVWSWIARHYCVRFSSRQGIVPLVQCLSTMHEALGSVPSTAKQGMVAHAFNVSTWEVEEAHKDQKLKVIPSYTIS